ncbi:hypothetical protein ACLMJK_007685 [Lecanora helva]
MAEAVAIIGLVASIASLVDLSAKVLSRLHDFTSKSSEVPESFRSLSTRLPLLTATLQHIQSQAEDGRFPDDITKALKAVIDDTSRQISNIQIFLSKVLPADSASKPERALKALKSLAKEDKVQQALEKIYKNNEILVLYQTTWHVDTGDRILEALSKLNITPATLPEPSSSIPFRKSQLAIELSYQIRERSPEIWVLWVHAGSTARFEQSFRDIANHIEIPGRQDPKVNIFRLVHDWLRDRKSGRWLLILDNIDNSDLFSEAGDAGQGGHETGVNGQRRQPVSAYLPQSQNGSILVTSRSKDVALKLVEEKDIVAVQPMAAADALSLFEKKLGPLHQGDNAAELAAALEFMPLAIAQAAAYISQRSPRYSVQQYLEDYRKSDRKKTSLLDYEGGQLRRDWEARNSIIITWQISFEYIRQKRPSASDLLSLMSFFDRQGIPEVLVRNRAEIGNNNRSQEDRDKHNSGEDEENSEDSTSERSKDDGFKDDIQILRDYLFLSVKFNGKLEQWKQQYIKNLSTEFPTGEYKNWTYCHTLFPHAKSAATQRPKTDDSLREWASLLYRAAWYTWRKGSITEAVDLSFIAMKVRKKLLGQEHKETLSSMGMVGLAYSLGGRWKEAEGLQVQVMETTKRVLGEEHPDTLTSIDNLASTYWNQGRWKEAEGLQVQVMEIRKRVLGQEHPDTLRSIGNLASTYWNQGRWKEAEQLDVQVMETTKRVLGQEHPDTLTSIANLASTYRNQGRWKEAEQLEVQVMETRKRVLGEEHPHTLTSMANLASTYRNQGRWKEAEQLEVQVMETRKRVLGEEHPHTLTSMANLASTYRNQGRWKEAEGLEVQVMETRKRVLGQEHPSTLTSIANLASTYRNQGRWKEAEGLEVQVMETTKRVLGQEHPSTLTSIANLASTYWNQGRWKEAEGLDVQVMETRKRVLGQEHPDTLTSIANLASTYRNQGRWKEAEGLEVQVMETRKRVLGQEHPDTLTRRWKEAEGLDVQVMETTKRVLGQEHPDTLTSIANLASTYRNQGRWKEAEQLEVQVMETTKRVLGEEHPDTLTSMGNLAFTSKSQMRYNEAISLMEICFDLRMRILGPKHPDTESSLQALHKWKSEADEHEHSD